MTESPSRVVVADDQRVVREGLAMLIGLLDGIEVVATAIDGLDAVEQARLHRPDVVVMDLRMPQLDGVQARRSSRPCPPWPAARPTSPRRSSSVSWP